MASRIVIGIICIYFLIKEYSKAKLQFSKAMALHFITTIFIVAFHSSSVRGIFRLFIYYKQTREELMFNLNELNSTINFLNYIISNFMGILLFIFGIGLIYRDDKSRKII